MTDRTESSSIFHDIRIRYVDGIIQTAFINVTETTSRCENCIYHIPKALLCRKKSRILRKLLSRISSDREEGRTEG